ncbi:hypothetical protein M406DRAFT_321593 [Cryphonectria parasitica EP155]|uniref:Uncharacterized protein n=1 Tax=Cryphonectria parasitica (strain ATCC 38755 / EP155) TaxID=660469 RepID=A0A9P5CRP6_CRYP1|nr:uncharacterized protein M406DRAFT_321593 [Cryphonectria parasitica EP155]KAF3767496.1 hypothetical protein M406DRAFT_321593 [Cryphonectria parasitica EP155]
MTDQEQTQVTGIEEAPGLANFGTSPTSSAGDRRMSAEWDASKTPPSRFQRRKGSIYSTPASRDGHVDKNYADKYHDKLAEKGWGKK